jgi:alkylhydroperoxidase/carboxymuconolactone decarboxylase family protein YurZ
VEIRRKIAKDLFEIAETARLNAFNEWNLPIDKYRDQMSQKTQEMNCISIAITYCQDLWRTKKWITLQMKCCLHGLIRQAIGANVWYMESYVRLWRQ